MINSVCLVGNLAADPEVRSTPSGAKVAKMRIAVNDYWTNRQTGERNEKTHWIPLNAWERMADTCERYLKRGMKIAVRGSLDYQEWTNNEGAKRSRIEVRVREMEILTPKGGDQQGRGSQGEYSSGSYSKQPQKPPVQKDDSYAQGSGGSNYQQTEKDNEFPPIEDDDIPF